MGESVFVGIDVAKAHLDVCCLPDERRWRETNDAAGWQRLIANLLALEPQQVVLEASGGYERDFLLAAAEAGLPVRRINARQGRDLAKALGLLEKTDQLDALALAHCARCLPPRPRQLPDARQQQLTSLSQRRRQLAEELARERNRLAKLGAHAHPAVAASLNQAIERLTAELGELDRVIEQTLANDPVWVEQAKVLRAVKGVGPVITQVLLADLPELGRANDKEIAKLVGLAPIACDSGQHRGRRSCWGGRAKVRCALWMGALAAIRWDPWWQQYYQGLLARGKPKKVAQGAVARKLLVWLNRLMAAHLAEREAAQAA